MRGSTFLPNSNPIFIALAAIKPCVNDLKKQKRLFRSFAIKRTSLFRAMKKRDLLRSLHFSPEK